MEPTFPTSLRPACSTSPLRQAKSGTEDKAETYKDVSMRDEDSNGKGMGKGVVN